MRTLVRRKASKSAPTPKPSSASGRNLTKVIDHLGKAIAAVSAGLELREILYTVLKGVRDGLGFDRAGVFLIDESAGIIRGEIGTDPSGALEEIHSQIFSLDTSDNNFAKVALGDIPYFYTDDASKKLPASQTQFMTVDIKQNAIIPMSLDSRVIGMIAVDNVMSRKKIEQTDIQLLQIFAAHAALAIEHWRLHSSEEKIIDRLKELDTLKSRFISETSHELKTPLATIHEAASILQKDLGKGELKEKYPHMTNMIIRQTDHLLSLITDLLDLSSIEAGVLHLKRQKISLRKLIEDVQGELGDALTAKKIQLTLEVNKELEADVDPDHIRRVIRNLLLNAVHAVSESGHIQIVGGRVDKAIRLVFIDDGHGIVLKDLERMFQRFVRGTKPEGGEYRGTGLGLPLARSLVEAHGGHLFAESSGPGKGARFVMILPA